MQVLCWTCCTKAESPLAHSATPTETSLTVSQTWAWAALLWRDEPGEASWRKWHLHQALKEGWELKGTDREVRGVGQAGDSIQAEESQGFGMAASSSARRVGETGWGGVSPRRLQGLGNLPEHLHFSLRAKESPK